MLNRRKAIGFALAGAAAFRFGTITAATTTGFGDRDYAGAMVIDALGAAGGSDPSLPDDAPLSPKDIAEMGQVIYDSGKRLERLIENFLIYAQIELLGSDAQKISALRKKQTATARSLIEAHAREQARMAHRPQDLALEMEETAVPMSEDYLAKIVDELVQNAFKFSQVGTPVRVSFSNSSNVVTLSVTDQGRGFSTEHITKVGAYMQFDRKMQEQQGLGLGLTIAKRLTELHGGTLAIQSQRGAATTVTMKLPK